MADFVTGKPMAEVHPIMTDSKEEWTEVKAGLNLVTSFYKTSLNS